MQKGISATEEGLKAESIEWSLSDPMEYSKDIYDGNDGFAHGFNPSVSITLSGEISSTVGVPTSGFGAAVTFANETNAALSTSTTYGGIPNTGGFYPESITVSESRAGWKTYSITAISHPAIT